MGFHCYSEAGWGLGVKDLVCFNHALLGKWAWRAIIGGGNMLWLDLVQDCEYGVRNRGCGRELIDEESKLRGWWGEVRRSLLDSKGSWFLNVISRKVGNGESTLFWDDVWVGDVNLKSLFPRLFEVSLAKRCTVAEAGEWVDDRWVWRIGWRRELRSWEHASLSSLTVLMECRKHVNHSPDVWEWTPEPKKIFTVSSAYKLLLERKREVNEGLKPLCRLLWSNFAPSKAQAIAWRVLVRRIATRVELTKRGVLDCQAVVACPVCNASEESVNHLFVECSRASSLWKSCLNWVGLAAPLTIQCQDNFLQFCYLGNNKRQHMFLASLWVCIVWRIWKTRNDIVFNNGNWKQDIILGEIKSFLWNWGRSKGVVTGSNLNFASWCSNLSSALG